MERRSECHSNQRSNAGGCSLISLEWLDGGQSMAKSEAAKQVKLGFWVAAGFWVFALVAVIICVLILKAVGSH